jgi:hypothetical protein
MEQAKENGRTRAVLKKSRAVSRTMAVGVALSLRVTLI